MNLHAAIPRLLYAMTASRQLFWTRKDIARLLECSIDTVVNNEHALGLDKARRDINARLIRYRASIAARQLLKLNAELGPLPPGEPFKLLKAKF